MGCMDIYIIYILNIYRESVCVYMCVYTQRERVRVCVCECVCAHNFPGRHRVESVKDVAPGSTHPIPHSEQGFARLVTTTMQSES